MSVSALDRAARLEEWKHRSAEQAAQVRARQLASEYDQQVDEICRKISAHANLRDTSAQNAPDSVAFELVREVAENENNIGCLYLWGPTGTGKSCAALNSILGLSRPDEETFLRWARDGQFARKSDWVNDYFDNPQLWTAAQLKRAFAFAGRSDGQLEDLMDSLIYSTVLLIDDLGHTMSDSFGENLREVLSRFTGCLVITSQFPPETLVARWSGCDGCRGGGMTLLWDAIVRRIRDRCTVIEFQSQGGAGVT